MPSRTPLGNTAWVSCEMLSCRCRAGRSDMRLGRTSTAVSGLICILPGDLVHPPEARQGEEDGAVVRAPRGTEDADHLQRKLRHLLALEEAVAQPQAGPAGRLGAQQHFVARVLGGVGAKEPSLGHGEALAAPREGREVGRAGGHVPESLIRVAQRDRHGDLHAVVAGQPIVDRAQDVRRRRVRPEDDAQHQLGRAALGADDQAVVGGALDEGLLDPTGQQHAGQDETDAQRDRHRAQRRRHPATAQERSVTPSTVMAAS